MELNEYQALASRTIPKPEDKELSELRKEFSLALSEESGEVAGVLKKHLYHNHPLNLEKLMDELGDVLWHLSSLAEVFGLSLDEVATYNILKLTKRYPDGYSDEKSINREG